MKKILARLCLLFPLFLSLFCMLSLEGSAKKTIAKKANDILNHEHLPPSIKAVMNSDSDALKVALVDVKKDHLPKLLMVANQALLMATQKRMGPQILAAQENIRLIQEAQALASDSKQSSQKKTDLKESQSQTAAAQDHAAAGAGADAAQAQATATQAVANAQQNAKDRAKDSKHPAKTDAKKTGEQTAAQAMDALPVVAAAAKPAQASALLDVTSIAKDSKEKTAYESGLNDEIIRSYQRIENVLNLFGILHRDNRSSLMVHYGALLFQNVIKNYLRIFKINGKPFEHALEILHNGSYNPFVSAFIQCLAVTNPAHAKYAKPEHARAHAEKVLKKMYTEIQMNSVANDMHGITDYMCQAAVNLMIANVEAVKLLQKDKANSNLDFGPLELVGDEVEVNVKSNGYGIDFSKERFGNIIKHMLENHADILNSSLAQVKDVNAFDSEGFQPLLYAVLNNVPEDVACLLKEHKANPNVRDQYGVVPLLLVSDPKIKRLLIAAGASIDFQDAQGRTALMTACERGFKKGVEALIAQKANFKLVDAGGNTAYALATNLEVVALLDAYGAGIYEKERQAQLEALKQEKLKLEESIRKQKEDEAQKAEAQAAQIAQKKKDKATRKAARRTANKEQERAEKRAIGAIKLRSVLNRVNEKLEQTQKVKKTAAFSQMKTFAQEQQALEKEQKRLAREKRMKEAAAKLSHVLTKRSKRSAFERLQNFAHDKVIADEAVHKADQDLYIRTVALYNAIVLYEMYLNQGSVARHDAQSNMISAGIRFIDYYVKRGLKTDSIIAAMKLFKEKKVKDASQDNQKWSCRFELLEMLYNALAKAQNFNRGESGDVLVNHLAELSKKTQIDAPLASLIDAIRANYPYGVKHGLETENLVKFDIPLFYAHLHGFQHLIEQINAHLKAQRSKKIDPKVLAERINAACAPRSGAATAAAAK